MKLRRGLALLLSAALVSPAPAVAQSALRRKPAPSARVLGTSSLSKGLLVAWPFLEFGDLQDHSPTGARASLALALGSGTTWAETQMGPSPNYDDTGSHNAGLSADGTRLDLDSAGAVSVAAWVYCRSTQASSPNIRNIVGRDDGVSASQYFIRLGDSGTAGVIQWIVNTGSEQKAISADNLPLNKLVLVTGTWDGTTARVYFGPQQQGTVSASGTLTANNKHFTIGATTTSSRPFDGYVPFVAVWNRALSAGEVGQLAQAPWSWWTSGPLLGPSIASAAATVKFRRSLSPIGARVGRRQSD